MPSHVGRHFATACHVYNVVAVFSGAHALEPKAFPLSQVKNSLFIVTNHGRRNAEPCAAVHPKGALINGARTMPQPSQAPVRARQAHHATPFPSRMIRHPRHAARGVAAARRQHHSCSD